MRFRDALRFAALAFLIVLETSCGQYYRPVVIPINTTQPNPANFHAVFAVNSNGSFNPNPPVTNPSPTFSFDVGSAMQIDVSGDTIIGATGGLSAPEGHLNINPTHAAILPNGFRVFVASAGSVENNGVDVISAFTPAGQSAIATGFGSLTTFSLPNIGTNPNTGAPSFCRYLPDFVTAAQNTAVFVANFGVDGDPNCDLPSTDSIAVLNPFSDTITNIVSLPAGSHPVALAQAVNTNTNKIYSANQGNSTISSFNTVDMSPNPVTGFSGTTPVWMLTRSDGQKLYVLTQGDGSLVTINTVDDTAVGSVSVGPGANYMSYDANLGRLYVTNPANSTLFIFSTSGGPNDTPALLNSINLAATAVSGNFPSCVNPCPVSVAALPDGSRAYVASYTLSSCTDPVFSATCVVTPQVTVIDIASNTIKTAIPLLVAGSQPLTESIDCVPTVPYTPAAVPIPVAGINAPRYAARFRLSAAAAADSSHVYIGVCDAGAVADIITTTSTISVSGNQPDTLVTDLPAPFGAGFPAPPANRPPFQNPIFLLPGR